MTLPESMPTLKGKNATKFLEYDRRKLSTSEKKDLKLADKIFDEIKIPSNREIMDELKHFREDFNQRFGMKFSKQTFTQDDALDVFCALAHAGARFNEELNSDEEMERALTEAKGYVAILKLLLAWSQANGANGVKRKAEEFMESFKPIFEKAKHHL